MFWKYGWLYPWAHCWAWAISCDSDSDVLGAAYMLMLPAPLLIMTCVTVIELLTLLHLRWTSAWTESTSISQPWATDDWVTKGHQKTSKAIVEYSIYFLHLKLFLLDLIYFLLCKFNLAAVFKLPPLPQTGVWVTPQVCHGTLWGSLWWLLRASQTYAMQLYSIMSDQHLHNLYPSYSLTTNHMLFLFPARAMNNLYQ